MEIYGCTNGDESFIGICELGESMSSARRDFVCRAKSLALATDTDVSLFLNGKYWGSIDQDGSIEYMD